MNLNKEDLENPFELLEKFLVKANNKFFLTLYKQYKDLILSKLEQHGYVLVAIKKNKLREDRERDE